MKRIVYRELASCVGAMHNCERDHAQPGKEHLAEWIDRHSDRAEAMVKQYLPSGSGFDCGTKIDLAKSNACKLVFYTEFHHMSEHGYDGWTSHTVTVKPSLIFGFTLTISGRDRNQIKENIADSFRAALIHEFDE